MGSLKLCIPTNLTTEDNILNKLMDMGFSWGIVREIKGNYIVEASMLPYGTN